jgi:rhodanese-related sulfurtransferase
VLLDVPEDDEWQRGYAAGALHIPMGQVPARLAEIDAQAALYVICHAAVTSDVDRPGDAVVRLMP